MLNRHDWLDDGQVFLVRRDASGLNRPTTARARHGKRRGIRLIHPRRNRSPAATSIGGTCPPARSPAATLRAVLRKRGGLSKARAPRRVELLLETLASSLPSIAIACRAGQLVRRRAISSWWRLSSSRSLRVGRVRSSATHALCHIPENCTSPIPWICCRHPLNKDEAPSFWPLEAPARCRTAAHGGQRGRRPRPRRRSADARK